MTAGPKRTRQQDHDPRLEAATKRLRESADQADAIEAIREIVTNLLGCEEIALFKVGHRGDKDSCDLLWSFGIDSERHGTLEAFEESALHRVLQGELHVAQVAHKGHSHYGQKSLRALIPIRLKERTVAILVMLKLLPQKVEFDEADINLVKLLSAEAGRSLFEGSANTNA